MRVLHVQGTLAPRYGGPATVLPELARAQRNSGHDVVIATTSADYPSGEYHRPGWDHLPGSQVPVFYAPVQTRGLLVSRQLASYLWSAVRTFDVVHIHGLYRFPPTVAASLCRRFGVPYIIRPHGSLDPFLYARSNQGRVRAKRMYERLFDIPNLNAASAIQFTAEDELRRASFLGLRSPSAVIPNGLDWSRFESLPHRGRLRRLWGLGESPTVLYLGRLHHKKGLDVLVPAFDLLRRQVPTAQLVIAGPENDGYGKQVRRWVNERGIDSAVRFVGSLAGADVLQAYVDADVFVLPSYTENFGMTVVEAMACRLPVVISDQVNIHDQVSERAAGIVTACDADQVAAATLTLLGDRELRNRMGKAGRHLVRDRYSWASVVESLDDLYTKATGLTRRCRRPKW